MYSIQVHKRIIQITKLFYKLGLWSSGDQPTVRATRIKLFYSFCFVLNPISAIIGAFKSADRDESVLLMELAMMTSILLVQLLYILWKEKEIIELLDRVGVYSVETREEFTVVNEKTSRLMTFSTIFISSIYFFAVCLMLVVPFIGDEKKLFFNIGFPLDYKNTDFGYWTAYTFLITELTFSAIIFLFSVITWYLMLNCSLNYEVLGIQIKNMGVIKTVEETSKKRKVSDIEKRKFFLQNLIASIESHKYVTESVDEVNLLLSKLFLTQLVTSGLCICCSIYCLAFNNSENFIEISILFELLIYNIFNIFMVMHFGNEVMLSSDRLSYRLYESDWVDQPQSTKKMIIIFGELIMQPYEMVPLTLYPLTLETFRRILSSAYDMFNILKNFK